MIPSLKTTRYHKPEDIPTPSVVLPHPYKILAPMAGTFGTSSSLGYFGVPLDNSPESQSVRAHEYAHLSIHRLQPQLDNLEELVSSPDWYQVGLDNIVNGYCEFVGVDVSHLPIGKRCPPDTPRNVRAIHALQTLSFKKRKKFAGLSDLDVEMLQKASKYLRKCGRYAMSPNSLYLYPNDIAKVINRLANHFGGPVTPKNRSDLLILTENGRNAVLASGVDWCKMTIVHRKLDLSLNRKYLARKRVAGFLGAFRNPLRTLIPAFDGMAWSIKQKKQTGTILLDQSGSMHLSREDMTKMLQQAPHATIAAYSGHGRYGELRIYAEKGKYASDCSTDMNGNCVDGPALDWLAKQAEPRVWVCDGEVTGERDQRDALLFLECAGQCVTGNILRIPSIADYFEQAGIKP